MKLYDVCGDYSLCDDVSDKSIAEAKTSAYKWIDRELNGVPVKLGYHKKCNELHYLKSTNKNLKGLYLFL